MTAAINIPSTISSQDNTDPNWHNSFITMIEKLLSLLNLAIILPKMISLSHSLEYLKNLWHIDSGTTMHICISCQRFLDYQPIDKKEDIWIGTRSVQVMSMGIVQLELFKSDRSHFLVKLYNVLHVLYFMTNLISVSLL